MNLCGIKQKTLFKKVANHKKILILCLTAATMITLSIYFRPDVQIETTTIEEAAINEAAQAIDDSCAGIC